MTEEQNTPLNIWNDFAARALRTGAPVPSVQIEFDAEMARLGLAWNFSNNRKQKPKVIDLMVEAIKEELFVSGTVLRIAHDQLLNQWVLVDGQHRLAAVEASNTKQWFVVAVESKPADKAYATFDRIGSMRTDSDSVNGLLGWKIRNWASIIGALTIIKNNFDYSKSRKRQSPNDILQIADIAAKYKDAIMKIDSLPSSDLYSQIVRAPSAAIWIVACHHHPDLFMPWMTRAMKDDTITASSTEMRIREMCSVAGKNDLDRPRLMILSAMVWNAHYLNAPMPKLPGAKWGKQSKTKFPGIAGTPYAK
jgi:hypothetical protein